LPITETTGLEYASKKPGVMHACGHDGHTATLLGAAGVLKEIAPQLSGTIKLIFQPAEEGGCGADRMVKDGVLDGPKVDAIFGLHGWPGLKVGTVATKPGPIMAAVDEFKVTIVGKAGHAASPQDGVDPIVCAAAMIQALQSIVSRELDPADAAVLTVANVRAGAAFNVIPESATLGGTVRTLDPKLRDVMRQSMERICQGVAAAYRCRAEIHVDQNTPVTDNAPAMAQLVEQAATEVLGSGRFVRIPKASMLGEDFAFYLAKVPGCFFALGTCPVERTSYPMLHHSSYDFTDAAVPVGMRMMAELAVRGLG
jgi:amidohydrolase